MDTFISFALLSCITFLMIWGWVGTKKIKNLIYVVPFLFFFGIINLFIDSILNMHGNTIIEIYGVSIILFLIPLLYSIANYPFEDSSKKEKIVWFLSLALFCLIFYNIAAMNVEQCLGDGTKISSIKLTTFENYEMKINYYCGIYKLMSSGRIGLNIIIFFSVLLVLMEIVSKIIYYLVILILNLKKMRI